MGRVKGMREGGSVKGRAALFTLAFATTGWSQKDRKKESQDV
jgi:hypothetical protein